MGRIRADSAWVLVKACLLVMCILLLATAVTHKKGPCMGTSHTVQITTKAEIPVAHNATFNYTCDPPCELPAKFFQGDPERQIKQIFEQHLTHSQQQQRPVRVLDIGMNAGYFSLLSAAHGAQVTAFDPQPGCIKLMRKALARPENVHLRPHITVLNVGVGDVGKIHARPDQCGGSFQGSSQTQTEIPVIPVSSAWTLDDMQSRVELVKIDTEGAEVAILEDLLPYIRQNLVGAIVTELMPAAWEKRGANGSRGVSVLTALEAAASSVYLLYDGTPWGFPVSKADNTVPYITGALFTGFDWSALVQDRKANNAGCNAYFLFDS